MKREGVLQRGKRGLGKSMIIVCKKYKLQTQWTIIHHGSFQQRVFATNHQAATLLFPRHSPGVASATHKLRNFHTRIICVS